MNTTCLIVVPPKGIIDPKFLKDAVTVYPTVFGFALQAEGEIQSEVHAKQANPEMIQEIVSYADGHSMVVLGNWPKFVKDDVMPFVLTDKEQKPFMAMAWEGDFSNFADMNGDHTAESNVYEEVVSGRIDRAVKDAGGDMDQLFEQFRTENFQRTLKNAYKERGQYVFLPREGEPVIFGVNPMSKQFSWGFVSNTSGFAYAEKEPAPAKEEAPSQEVGFLERMRAKVTGSAKPAAGPVANPEVSKVVTIVKPPGSETVISLVEMKPPKQLEKGARNHWLRTFNGKEPGDLPGDHQSANVSVWVHPSMVEFAKRDVKSVKEMRQLMDEIKTARSAGKLADFPQARETTKDTGKSTTREPVTNYVNTTTVLDTKIKERQVDLLAKFLSEKKLLPIDIQKLESKWPQYSDEVGVTFEELLFLTPDHLMSLFDGCKPAVAAFLQMRRRYIEGSHIKLEDLVGTKGEEPKVVNTEASKAEVKPAVADSSTGDALSFLRRSAA